LYSRAPSDDAAKHLPAPNNRDKAVAEVLIEASGKILPIVMSRLRERSNNSVLEKGTTDKRKREN
jgi:NAD/NADP transhydrogenase beta subunit